MIRMDDLDYTGGLTLATSVAQLQQQGITVALASAEGVASQLDRLAILTRIAPDHVFESVSDAIDVYRRQVQTDAQ
jgi:hypothetical protein